MSDQTNAIQKVNTFFDNDIVKSRFENVTGSQREAMTYISSVLLTVANTPALQECTPTSIYISALRAATLRLSVDPGLGQAYLVPFKNRKKNTVDATLIVGYKGLYGMAIRTGHYRRIDVSPIYAGESIEKDRLTGALKILGAKESSEIIGWLGILQFTQRFGGVEQILYMPVEEIHAHAKRYSKRYDSQDGQWTTDTRLMEKKTVLRLLITRYGYLEPGEAQIIQDLDDDRDGDIIDTDFIETQIEDSEPRTNEQLLAELGLDND